MPNITSASVGGNQINVGGSNSVTINGSGFSGSPCSVSLTAPGLSLGPAMITSRSDTTITANFNASATAPSGGGALTITVTVANTTSNAFRTAQLTYNTGTA